jgi:hypothetical protein
VLKFILSIITLGILPLFFTSPVKTVPISQSAVVIEKLDEGFRLRLNGKPYFIKGAGGYTYYEQLKEYGGNSVRLWTTDNAKEYMDKAHQLGLTVTLGLYMELERHGFNYDNKEAVAKQLAELKKEVLKYKDHPALLMWGVGNEVDQFAKNYNVWNAVQDLAKFIHQVDPNHPTTTMLAGVPKKHIREIIKRCPDIDVLSINAFKDLPYIRDKISNAGWTGPYLIGEWGASGYWETPKTPWGAFIEETSTEKAEVCEQRYLEAIENNTDVCVGSYVFYWGYKQARTHTLLSLFLETGEKTGVIDVLRTCWSDETEFNKAPLIKPIGIDNKKIHLGVYLEPGSSHMAYTDCTDPEMDPLTYKWEIYKESTEKKEGGDAEEKPGAIAGLIIDGTGRALSFKAPEKKGAYRLFVYVFDGNNNVATANAPFYVK